jgi:hypothetical protein
MPMFQKEEIASELQNAVETIYRNDENQIALGLNHALNTNLFMKLKPMIFRF